MTNDDNARLVDFLEREGVLKTKRIIEAFTNVPRHMFVLEENMDNAYADYPLPLMKGATISQPSTVAFMLEYLNLQPGEKVLEIGTGSGWNAALMGYCIGKKGNVISLEIEKALAEFAERNISKTGVSNVTVLCKDGSGGYSEKAPYSRIVYTVAVDEVPVNVLEQLKIGGILLAPIGIDNVQVLTMMEKADKKRFKKKYLGYFQFVPMRSS